MEVLFGTIVWVVAVTVYSDCLKRNERGFRRLAAFWLGFPFTVVSACVVSGRKTPPTLPHPDEESDLLAEVRRDRQLRERTTIDNRVRSGDPTNIGGDG